MNGPEILRLIRHDLQRAVAERGELPTPQPMAASPWVAMSDMQKAIRRGREDLALSAAATCCVMRPINSGDGSAASLTRMGS